MRKARQALASSRVLLDAGDYNGACNRAYYAMFYSAHAALEIAEAIKPGAVVKTHGGLISIFSQKLVLAARIEEARGRALSKVYDMRLVADYEGDPLEFDDAMWAIDEAQIFVDAVQATFFE